MKIKQIKKTALSKTILAGLFISISFFSLNAQFIDKKFINMPDDILPSLTKEMRLELVEYYKMGQKDTIENSFQNNTFILNYDSLNQYIALKSAENTTFEMKLFPSEKGKMDSTSCIIGVINTVCAPVCSSYIQFFDSKWNRISQDIPKITASDWLTNKEEIKDGVKIADVFKSSFIEYHFNITTNQIIAKSNSMDLLSAEDKVFVNPYVKTDEKIIEMVVSGNKIILKL